MVNKGNTERAFSVHPKKVMLWLSMASITMFFAVTTSALLVKKGDVADWQNFALPTIFAVSTVIVILASLSMIQAVRMYKAERLQSHIALLGLSFILGGLFLLFQYLGWNAMKTAGIFLDGNASGSFIYVLSGAHGLHIIGGLIAIMVSLYKAWKESRDPLFELKSVLNPERILSLELLATYWHFVNIVWIYLYLFFYFNYQ